MKEASAESKYTGVVGAIVAEDTATGIQFAVEREGYVIRTGEVAVGTLLNTIHLTLIFGDVVYANVIFICKFIKALLTPSTAV